jgi:precorrin-2/cobalt-factor-2 C20-methyltransferase
MANEVIVPLAQKADDEAPYFAMVIVPGAGRRP